MTYETLYNKYNKPLSKFLATILKNPQDAEDISQETWMAVFQRFNEYDQSEEFSPWLFEIGKNKAINFLKSYQEQYEIPISNLGEEEYSEMNNILYSIYEETYAD